MPVSEEYHADLHNGGGGVGGGGALPEHKEFAKQQLQLQQHRAVKQAARAPPGKQQRALEPEHRRHAHIQEHGGAVDDDGGDVDDGGGVLDGTDEPGRQQQSSSSSSSRPPPPKPAPTTRPAARLAPTTPASAAVQFKFNLEEEGAGGKIAVKGGEGKVEQRDATTAIHHHPTPPPKYAAAADIQKAVVTGDVEGGDGETKRVVIRTLGALEIEMVGWNQKKNLTLLNLF